MTTKYQTESLVIHRSQINNAPYNPRKISDKALAKLKKNISERGLMGGIVWNKLTGNLVSGHQRLKVLDQLEKSKDYEIRVEMCELDHKQEKEQNIFMNSTTVQGEFDYDILKDLIIDIDTELAGLDDYDLNMIGIEGEQENEEETDEINDIKTMLQPLEDRKAAVKASKAAYKEQLREKQADQFDSYVTLTFDTFKAKESFMKQLGFNEFDLFIKGEVLTGLISIK